MQLKSYFSGTVEAAMKLARKELAQEGLLVNARPAAPEACSLARRPPGAASNEGETRRAWPRPASPLCANFSKEAYEVVLRVVNSPRTPEVLKSPKASESLLKQRAAA
jgi:hypothetical protein